MTRLRATRAATADGSLTIQASTQLMDDYVYATDVGAATNLVSVQQPDGCYSLLYIGSTGNVMSLRQDEASDTGWTEEPLGNNFLAGQVVGSVDASGGVVAFAVGPNASAPDLYFSRRDTAGWSAWQAIAPDANVPPSMQVINIAAASVQGKAALVAILTPGSDGTGSAGLWQIGWSDAAPAWTNLADSDQTVLEFGTIAGTAQILYSNTAIADPNRLDLFTVPAAGGGNPQVLASSVAFTTLASGTQADGNTGVFIADTGTMSGLRQTQYLNGGNPAAGFVQVDTNTSVTALAVASAGATPMTLFALDMQGALRLIADPTLPADGDDFDFALCLSSIVTAMDKQGNAELIGFIPAKGLIRLWANPATGVQARDGWSQEGIQYQAVNQALSQSSTYATTLTFYGANGALLPNQALMLRATEIVTVLIAGVATVLGPKAVAVETNPRGSVRITMPTGSVNAPQFSVTLPGLMAADEDFAVSPDADLKNRFAALTIDEVTQLIPAEFASRAADVQKAVQETMASVSSGPVAVIRHRVGARADLKTPISNTGALRGAHAFSVINGRAVFTPLSAEEARARIAKIAMDPRYGVFDWFEDAVESIGEVIVDGAECVYHHILEPVANGINVAIHFVSDTIQIAWTGLIETVEDAFRFVQTVFESVKTFFERLYDFFAWLLSNARKDIWATKSFFDSQITQGLADLAGYAANGAAVIPSFFMTLEQSVGQMFAQIETDLGLINANDSINATPSLTADGAVDTVLEIIENAAATANWLIDKVADLLGLGVNPSLPDSVVSDAVSLAGQVATAFGQEIIDLATAFLDKLQTLASSTANLGNVLLKTLLDEAKDILLAILKLLDSLVQSFLTFFSNNLQLLGASLFGAAIGNSFVQALYDLINPGSSEELTVQRLACLLLGFVTTVSYKVVFNEVPFPSEALAQSAAAELPMILAGFVQTTIWLGYDIHADADADAVADPQLKWWYLALGILTPLAIQLGSKPPGSPAFDNPAIASKWAAWFTGFSGIAFKTVWGVLMFANKEQKGPRGSLPGSIGIAACGAATLGTNIWMGVKNSANTPTWISLTLSPLSQLVKPAKHLIPTPVNQRVVIVTDTVSDVGGGIAKIVKGFGGRSNDTSPADPSNGSAILTLEPRSTLT